MPDSPLYEPPKFSLQSLFALTTAVALIATAARLFDPPGVVFVAVIGFPLLVVVGIALRSTFCISLAIWMVGVGMLAGLIWGLLQGS